MLFHLPKLILAFTVLVLPEVFDTLVHGLEGVVDTVDEDVCIDVDERVIHPCLVPLLPVCSCDPQVPEGFKLFSQPTQLVITAKNTVYESRKIY